MSATSHVAGSAAFFYRPYHYDHRFLERYAGSASFDAALLLGRHLAPHPAGSDAARRGANPRRLADAVASAGGGFVVDPDTAILTAAPASGMPPRIPLMASAQAVSSLPITPMALAAAANRQAFVRATIGAQAGAFAVSAPYFQFEARGDRWYQLNLDMTAITSQLDPARDLAVFVQAPTTSLRAGHLAAAAQDYADLGARYAMLRIAGFDPVQADTVTASAYLRAVEAFANVGVTPVADAVGRFGLVCVAAGAGGFSSGVRFYQTVPENPVYDFEDMRSTPELYEVPERWFAIHPDALRASPGVHPACPVGGCGGADALKEHLIHYFTERARQYRVAGPTAARNSLAAHPAGNTAAWLAAM